MFPALLILIVMVAIWGNWIFHDRDGFALPIAKRPGLIRFFVTLVRNPRGTLDSSAFW